MMKAVGIIPARWGSTRFEGKILALLNGQPMIEHVWRQAKKAKLLEEIYIACDDNRIYQAAQDFGAEAIMTAKNHESGTDRIAEAAATIATQVVVNIQGDEPMVDPKVIDRLTGILLADHDIAIATVIKRISHERDVNNTNIVKVVIDHNGDALYFSRSPIPFDRAQQSFADRILYKHVGLYGYQKDFLLNFKNLPVSQLEVSEKLEQLRVVEAGFRIRTIETDQETIGVDTLDDLRRVEEIFLTRDKNNG